MKKTIIKFSLVVASILYFDTSALAEETISKVASDKMQLINIAGKQRMLSQRIAKDYMYAGNSVAVAKANKQLASSLKELKDGHKKLVNSINDEEIRNLLSFVAMSSEDFETTAK
jgi:hypothetical protein